ncbi:MAG: hypothetical protein HOO96_23850 [Polyangiaceae bacterium]|nr:hypothetical protein [Polyangiaceae bacterium]
MGGYFDGSLQFWSVSATRPVNPQELAEHAAKRDVLDRIQIEGRSTGTTRPSSEMVRTLRERFFEQRPGLGLRLYHCDKIDLSFLEDLPTLERLTVEASGAIENPQALGHLHNLKAATFELPKKAPRDILTHLPPGVEELSLTPYDRTSADIDLSRLPLFPRLSSLHLDAYERDLARLLPALAGLQRLALRSAKKLASLEPIRDLCNLHVLALQQLGAVGDLSPLGSLSRLRSLQLWRLPKVGDLSVVSKLGSLELLDLETMSAVTSLPDLTQLRALRFVKLAAMKNLRDFTALERAPALEELVFQKAEHQRPDDFVPLLRNRSLQRAGLGFHKKADVARMVQLAAEHRVDAEVYMYPQFRGAPPE